jgi:hypothetical protein
MLRFPDDVARFGFRAACDIHGPALTACGVTIALLCAISWPDSVPNMIARSLMSFVQI